MKSVTNYPFNLSAGQSINIPAVGDYFRVQSSTGAIDVTIDGVGTLPDLLNGQGIKNIPFGRLTIKDKSGAANAGVILVAFEEFIDNRTYGVNDLSAGTLNTLRQPLAATGSFASTTTLAAAAVETVLAPASNINGAIILTGQMTVYTGSTNLVTKTSAPTSGIDGEVIATVLNTAGGAIPQANTLIQTPQFVPAGRGIYFYCVTAENTGYRNCRFRLL